MPTRRQFLQTSSAFAALCFNLIPTAPAEESSAITKFMAEYDVPGLTFACAQNGEILFTQGYGLADRHHKVPVTPISLFRIASISKSITSAAIFKQIQTGKLTLATPVFGTHGVLDQYRLPPTHPDWIQAITIHHLLTHTAGGWSNHERDPMFHDTKLDKAKFLQHTLDNYPLETPPGTQYAYSNFGYFLLGRVLERTSNQPYQTCVQQNVLNPSGIDDMRLGTQHPAPSEVYYQGQGKDDPYSVPIELHDANGGWIATPTDLVKFASAVFASTDPTTSNSSTRKSLFPPELVHQITQGTPANPNYACGWSIHPDGTASHSGGFDGTNSFLVHSPTSLTWAIIVNTRRPHSEMEEDLHKLSLNLAMNLAIPRDKK